MDHFKSSLDRLERENIQLMRKLEVEIATNDSLIKKEKKRKDSKRERKLQRAINVGKQQDALIEYVNSKTEESEINQPMFIKSKLSRNSQSRVMTVNDSSSTLHGPIYQS